MASAPPQPAPLAGGALALVALALALGTFMQVLDTTIANVSLPTIAGNLGVSSDLSTWIVTAFAVANGVAVPLTGWLMGRFGVVRTFCVSVFLFTIASFLCGIAWDLPGLGLASRPAGFDYSWTGLGRFCVAAVDALELDSFHLVVHDIGGPVGFELAAAMPERIASLTVLDTIVEVDTFRRPPVMEPFAWRGVGPLYVKTLTKRGVRLRMRLQGIEDSTSVPGEEVDAYVDLLRGDDGGAAFLQIMRSFERTPAKRERYVGALRDVPYPVQVVWGENDPALTLSGPGEAARRAAGLETIHRLPAKHFLQEDQAPAIAELVAQISRR